MSKIRYEQTQDTSHVSHVHDGLNGSRLQYDKALHSQPRMLNNAREAKVRIMGKQGTIDYLEHGCGLTPIVKCYVGGREVKIGINIDRTTGFVTWSSEQEFTRADEAYMVIYGLATEYIIDDDTPEVDLTEYWCGYEWNVNDSDPSVKRITGKGLEDYFLREGGGILKGKLFKYVAVNPTTKEEVEVPIDDPTEYENYRYGQHGDLFAKMRGQLYYKVEKEGNVRRKKLSRYNLPGFRPYHSNDYIVYIGLYEASCNNERTKIYSRVTPQSEYSTHLGGYKKTSTSGSYAIEKFYNTPATLLNTSNFSNIAHSKGEGYDIMDYMTWLMISDLFMAEFGTRNCQAPIQSADSNGYSQGGLGNGCINISNYAEYNNNNPVAELGCTDSLGSGYGQRLIPACSNGVEPANNVYANRFYGIENPFGHIFKFLTGLHIITKAGEGQTYESRNIYICDNPEKFMVVDNRDLDTDDIIIQFEAGYNFEGNAPIGNGYIKDVVMGTYGSMLASENGASSATYFCDYNYTNYYENQFTSSLRWTAFGGSSVFDVVFSGFFFHHSYYEWSNTFSNCGTRLCLYKQPYEEMPFFVEDCSGEENEVVIAKKASHNTDVDAPLAPDVYLEYSYDTINWKTLPVTSVEGITIYLPPNGRVYLRGDNYTLCNRYDNAGWIYRYTHISCNNTFNLGGNIMSLLYKDFIGKIDLTNNGIFTFAYLFSNNTKLISSNKLVLPATILNIGCYGMLFKSCNNHVYTIKQLPATNLYSDCYTQMYAYNSNLLYTPKESFTEGIGYCFYGMYKSNKKITEHKTLINIRKLRNKTFCFRDIFQDCSNLKLVYAPRLDYDNKYDTFTNWIEGVHPTGTIYIPYDVDWRSAPRSGSGIPAGWEIKYIDPETMEERESLYPIE